MSTFHKINVHIVFSTLERKPAIRKELKAELCNLISRIIISKGQVPLAVNCLEEHVHIFISQEPSLSLTVLIDDIKASAKEFISGKIGKSSFAWQEGFASFSYSPSHVDAVIRYIDRQEEHHRSITYEQEMIDMLDMLEVEYSDHELFAWFGSVEKKDLPL